MTTLAIEAKDLVRDFGPIRALDHLSFEVPVVTVFGPTHPEWTEIDFPRERKVAVQVFCGPCQKKVCPLDHRCMTRVTPGMVFEAGSGLLHPEKVVQVQVNGVAALPVVGEGV